MEPEPSDKKRQEPPPIEFLRPGETQAPPPTEPQAPVAWVPSPEEFQRRPVPQAQPVARAPGNRGTLAGVSLIISAVLGFIGIVTIYLIPVTLQDYYNYTNSSQADLITNGAVQTLVVWPQVFGLLGGIMAIQRKNYRLAAACAFVSTANIFSPYFLGTLAGLLGLMILISARHEFTS